MIGRNNLFNIRYCKTNNWIGQIGHTRGFCDFDSIQSCYKAFWKLMFVYYSKSDCRTIRDVVSRYAPPSENGTEGYIKYCCNYIHENRCSFLEMSQWLLLGEAIHRFECGFPVPLDYYDDFMNIYFEFFYNKVQSFKENV